MQDSNFNLVSFLSTLLNSIFGNREGPKTQKQSLKTLSEGCYRPE